MMLRPWQSQGWKHFTEILEVPGMLTQAEERYLYELAQLNSGKGVIVEIGSWKGTSTIYLAYATMLVGDEKVYAIDPHKPSRKKITPSLC